MIRSVIPLELTGFPVGDGTGDGRNHYWVPRGPHESESGWRSLCFDAYQPLPASEGFALAPAPGGICPECLLQERILNELTVLRLQNRWREGDANSGS